MSHHRDEMPCNDCPSYGECDVWGEQYCCTLCHYENREHCGDCSGLIKQYIEMPVSEFAEQIFGIKLHWYQKLCLWFLERLNKYRRT